MKARQAFGLLVAGTVFAVTAACSASDAEGGEKLQKLTFRGPFVTSGGDAPLYYARELGYFKDAGIDLEITDSKSSVQTIDDVASGGAEFGEADGTATMLAAGAGRPIVTVASTVGRSSFGFFVPQDSGIQAPQDLAGKRVAAIPQVEASMLAALNAAGMAKEDIKPVFADSNALVTTYLGGGVDALYTSAALAGALQKRPSSMLLQSDMGYNPPDFGIIVRRDFLDKDPELVRKFTEAVLKGFQAASTHPEEAISALLKAHPELDRTQATSVLGAVSEFLCSDAQKGKPYGRNAEADWSAAAKQLETFAGLKGGTGPDRFMTNEFFDQGSAINAGDC